MTHLRCAVSSWGEAACGSSEVLLGFLLGEKGLAAHLRCAASLWGRSSSWPI